MDTGTSLYDYLQNQYIHTFLNKPWAWQYKLDLPTIPDFGDIKSNVIPESTDQSSINSQNDRYLKFLRSKESYFVTLLHRCDFEDGITNDAIEFACQNFNTNKSVTCNWFNEVYGRHLSDKLVLCGLLRILAYLRIKDYEDTFIPMIVASLNDESTECQEAALMLIEVIRSKECLDAVKSTKFQSAWINEYAESIVKDLIEELGCGDVN